MSFTNVTYRKTEDICVFYKLFAEMFVYYEETHYFWSGIFTLSKTHCAFSLPRDGAEGNR